MGRGVEAGLAAALVGMGLALGRTTRLALADPLTGLANRRALARAWARQRGDGRLIFIDLQGFKAVNDRLGHGAGDEVLKRVAECLARAAGPDTLVARVGGDEFAILGPSAGAEARRCRLARALDGIDPPGLGLWLGETIACGQPLAHALADAEADLQRRRPKFKRRSRLEA